MKRVLTQLPEDIPDSIRKFTEGAVVYDSSCSVDARVYFIDMGDGFFLKHSPEKSIVSEALMYRFFHQKGLGPELLDYVQDGGEWILTAKVQGEDCTDAMYLNDPKRLCDTTASLLRQLHETDFAGCPIPDRLEHYFFHAQQNHDNMQYSSSLFTDIWHFTDLEEAWQVALDNAEYLRNDTLIHGDYCLPNVILDNWKFSGFIDIGDGGVGDRHIDLFWGIWTLFYNLGTNKYRERFLDAYGRDKVNPDLLRTIAAIEAFG